MIRNRPTVGDPEIRFKVVRNLSGQAFVRGDSVYYAAPNDPGAGTFPNGIVVGLPIGVARVASLFAGLVWDDAGIANGALGKIQTSGVADYAKVASDLAVLIEIGDYLEGVVSAVHLVRATTPTHVVSLAQVSPGAVVIAARNVLLRCPE